MISPWTGVRARRGKMSASSAAIPAQSAHSIPGDVARWAQLQESQRPHRHCAV